MRMTLAELEKIVSTMKAENVTEINVDVDVVGNFFISSIDFDIWKDDYYDKTIVSLTDF